MISGSRKSTTTPYSCKCDTHFFGSFLKRKHNIEPRRGGVIISVNLDKFFFIKKKKFKNDFDILSVLRNLKIIGIFTKIRSDTNIAYIIDNIIKVYQDGIYIGQTESFKKLYKYKAEPYFYLGVGNPKRDIIPNYFKGYIDTFAYYDNILTDNQIKEISIDNTDLRNYKSKNDLKIYYDANYIENYKLTDLSEDENNGDIIGCEIVESDFLPHCEIQIPNRRNSIFKSLPHEENGFLGNKWKDISTRYNQLRFVNEVSNHSSLLYKDGLDSLEFTEYGKINENNITHINVGI